MKEEPFSLKEEVGDAAAGEPKLAAGGAARTVRMARYRAHLPTIYPELELGPRGGRHDELQPAGTDRVKVVAPILHATQVRTRGNEQSSFPLGTQHETVPRGDS